MATLGGTVLTWADMIARLDPDGMPARIANVLEESKPILSDMPWKATNQPLGHRSSVLTGLPTVGFKRLNTGGLSSKSTVAQVEEGLSMIEGWSTTDIKLLELYGNEAAVRMGEGRFFVESMGQLAVDTIWYGNVLDTIDEFNGFTTRYNSLSGNIADNVLDAGGTGSDLSSVWLIGWGDGKIFGAYPKNCYAGLRHKDWGEQLIQTDDDLGGRKLAAMVDQWNWDLGIVIQDWRYAVRIANIEPDDLIGVTAGGTQELNDYTTNLLFLMKRALRHIPNLSACQPRWYMPRAIAEGLDVQFLARTTENVWLTKDVEGKMVETFFGIPIRIEDSLTNTESEVVA